MEDKAQYTDAELAYAAAFAEMLKLDAQRIERKSVLRAVHDVLVGQINSTERVLEVLDLAIHMSGLDADSAVVKSARRAGEDALKFSEAVDNGMDPNEAELIIELGGDPRMSNPIGGDSSGFEF